MIQSQKKIAKFAIDTGIGFVFALFMFIVIPEFGFVGRFTASAFVFFIAATSSTLLSKLVWSKL
ncbi:MAG TPA: hypothetical protein PK408_09870, partial [Treponemataceae bacterium]|nr:hypothetical protein [Treponemataceae bacterium]